MEKRMKKWKGSPLNFAIRARAASYAQKPIHERSWYIKLKKKRKKKKERRNEKDEKMKKKTIEFLYPCHVLLRVKIARKVLHDYVSGSRCCVTRPVSKIPKVPRVAWCSRLREWSSVSPRFTLLVITVIGPIFREKNRSNTRKVNLLKRSICLSMSLHKGRKRIWFLAGLRKRISQEHFRTWLLAEVGIRLEMMLIIGRPFSSSIDRYWILLHFRYY